MERVIKDQTRRELVLTIGQAAVGLAIDWKAQAAAVDPAALPPGVYLPSSDHLSHALMSADRYHPIPAGCPTDYVRPANKPFEPLFFSKSEFPMILRLTQLLLGDLTDNSAVSREVAEWIDLQVSSADGVYQAERQVAPLHRVLAVAYRGAVEESGPKANSARIYRQGLSWIIDQAHAQHSTEFLSLDSDQQTGLLRSIGDERTSTQNENPGTAFFGLLKAETIRGFYTSQVGLKELNFKGNAFYARSPGCQTK